MLPMLFAALLGTVGTAQAQQSELEVAYQREFAYLQAEKQTLESRLSGLDSEARKRVRDAENELATLQSRLLALRSRVAGQEELLSSAMRESDQVAAAQDLIRATLFQAASSLGNETPTVETPDEQAAALIDAYGQGAAKMQEGAQVRKEQGSYFLTDGTKVDGTIVRVGRIAAYGVGQESGALLPLGEGKLAIRDTEAASVAEGLANGARPQPLGIFAFEDNGKRVEESAEKTFWSVMAAGGIIGWVIAAIGVVGLILAGFRAVTIFLAGRGSGAVTEVLELLDNGRWDEAANVARSAPGAASRVLASMIPLGPSDIKRLEDRASEAILLQTPPIERFGTAILVIAAVAPLLGLLGTVTGMIGTFEIITEFGTGDPRMLSGGISEALVTTQLGLIVAIPMLLLGNLLNQSAEGVLSGLETSALAVINRATVSGKGSGDPADDEPTQAVKDPGVEASAHGK